jgi:hypothetical protein
MKPNSLGRPKLPKNIKKGVFSVRLNHDEKRTIVVAAKRSGQKAAEWARVVMLAQASAVSGR